MVTDAQPPGRGTQRAGLHDGDEDGEAVEVDVGQGVDGCSSI